MVLPFLAPAVSRAQFAFKNLDFEEAKIVPWSVNPGFAVASEAFPNWTVYVNGSVSDYVAVNSEYMGTVCLYYFAWIQGDYAVILNSNPGSTMAIGQIGTIPANARSLLFKTHSVSAIADVSFAGQSLVSTRLSYTNWNIRPIAVDVSAFAGRTGELRFSGGGAVDDIRFSEFDVPSVRSTEILDPLSHWTASDLPLPSPASISSAVSTPDGVFFATGSSKILASTNGTTWRTIELPAPIYSLGYGEGLYIAGGEGGNLLISTNTFDWESASIPGGGFINAIVYGNGVFLAHDGLGRITRSTNGVIWNDSGLGPYNYAITFGGGLFLIGAGQLGYSTLLTSPDAMHWSEHLSRTENSQSGTVFNLGYGNGVYFARTFYAPSNRFLCSFTGTNWTYIPDAPPAMPISFGAGTFIGVLNGQVATSTNGLQWLKRAASPAGIWGFIYGLERFFAWGEQGLFQSDSVNEILSYRHSNQTSASQIKVRGLLERTYKLEASSDLATWAVVRTNTNLEGVMTFSIRDQAGQNFQFFRTVLE